MVRRSIGVAALLVLGAGTALGGGQGQSQQRCINKVNKAAIRVQAAQGKVNADCVKAFLKGTLGSAEDCLLSDPKSKVTDNQLKLLRDEERNCASPLPTFAYNSDGLYVGTTAAQAEIDLAHDLFGSPVDAGLDTCDDSPDECLCQRQTMSRIGKMSRTVGKIWLKCKRAALDRGELLQFPNGAQNIGDLQRCVTDAAVALSVEKRIAATTLDLEGAVGQFCYQSSDEFDGGVCAGFFGDPAGLADCLEQRVRCRFCRMVNAVDEMGIDCAIWSGGACP
ncbi:MAG: hypothetical protein ACRERC_04275 [Candidatus Binatia bacterium]